jgi:hypothetical protein
VLDVDAWTWSQPSVSAIRPPPLSVHTAVAQDGQMLVFGGMSSTIDADGQTSLTYSSDVWTLDCLTMEWARLRQRGVPPKGVAYHAAPLSANGQLLVLGGWRGEVVPSSELASLDMTTGVWHQTTIQGETPASMYGHTAVVVGSKVVTFGGWDSINPMNVVHVLDTGERARCRAFLARALVPLRALCCRRGLSLTPSLVAPTFPLLAAKL